MARKAAAKRPARDLGASGPWAPSPGDAGPAMERDSPSDAVCPDVLGAVAAHLARGEAAPAAAALLPALDRRAAEGDRACGLAASLLRLAPLRLAPDPISAPASGSEIGPAPDALAAAAHRLTELLRRQDEQIRSLQDLVEDLL